ncbi:MAG: TonB-dependent receptor [Agarilytica sp.]
MLPTRCFKIKPLGLAIGVIALQASLSTYAQNEKETTAPPARVEPETPDLRLEEVIVTAQKIAENIQDVPISVSAVNAEKLADAGIENLEDLTAYLPNIHFTESGFSTQVRVRGIGSDNSQGFEQSVGMYIDGIYYGRAQLFRTPMMDMQRAELLRGPQSTLFGKNSVAGALNLTTATPTEELEAKFSVSQEFEHNQTEVNAMISGPISDTLRARFAHRGYTEDGYFENTFKDVDEADTEETATRLTLDFTPTESLSFLFKVEQNEFETSGRAIEITQDIPLVDGASNYSEWLQLFSQPPFDPELDYRRQTDIAEFSDNEIENVTLTTNYDFNDYTLTLVTGQLGFEYTELCDCDFVSAEILELELFEEYDQFSQEIRITSPLGERIEWVGGLYYQDYDQTFEDRLPIRNTNALPPILIANGVTTAGAMLNTGAGRDFHQSSEAWAAFGRIKINATDQLNFILGARYTEEEKNASKRIFIYNPTTGAEITDPSVGGLYLGVFLLENEALAGVGGGHNVSGSRKETPFDPLAIVEYNFSDDMMTYASLTTGSKAGGFDPRSNNAASFEFENENSFAFETGIKNTLAGGRGELNAAFYRTDYGDLQISQFDGGVGFNVGNAKETLVQGIEVDGRWLLADGLTTSYGIAWLDFEYKDFENGNCHAGQTPDGDSPLTCDYTGKRGVYTPEYTINVSLDYLTEVLPGINFIGFIDVQHVDGHNVHVNLDPDGEIDAHTILNARVGLEGEYWAVGLLGKNLLDEEVISYSGNAPLSDSSFGTNTHYSFIRRPMTIALEGTLKF